MGKVTSSLSAGFRKAFALVYPDTIGCDTPN